MREGSGLIFPESWIFANYNSQLLPTGQCAFPALNGFEIRINDDALVDAR
jgi:hypothetical protein